MLCYKMTEKGRRCRGVQLQRGLNVEKAANCAKNGWHAATDPLCCLSYYPNEDKSEFWLCDASGDIDEDGSDEKLSCTELTLLRQLSKFEFVTHAVAYILKNPEKYPQGFSHGSIHIVRGVSPKASGALGDVLAFIRESEGEVTVAVIEIDGKTYCAGVRYALEAEVTVDA